jgi:hypothetical protein
LPTPLTKENAPLVIVVMKSALPAAMLSSFGSNCVMKFVREFCALFQRSMSFL